VVVVSVPARRPEATDHLIVASIRTWDPKQSPTGEVDFAAVREDMQHLPSRFLGLRRILVDEGAEAGSVLPWAKQHPSLTLLIEGFVGSVQSNMGLWRSLTARLHAQTIAIPRHERLLSELRNLRREEFAFGSKWRVVDSSRKFHRDVSLALAGAVYASGQRQRLSPESELTALKSACVGSRGSPWGDIAAPRHPGGMPIVTPGDADELEIYSATGEVRVVRGIDVDTYRD
jgi:hypothetical protein